MYLTKLALLRFAELVESKMAVYKAAAQVAEELQNFEDYVDYNRIKINPKKLTTDHLRTCKYK